MNYIEFNIPVGATLKAYIVTLSGDDAISPAKDSSLYRIINKSMTYYDSPKMYDSDISIKIYMTVNNKCYNAISKAGVNRIKAAINDHFRTTFLNYMKALQNNTDFTIGQCIEKFCDDFYLDSDDRLFERLRKLWWRYSCNDYPEKLSLF